MRKNKSEPSVDCICQVCGKAFKQWPYRVRVSGGKFCSLDCYHVSLRQYENPEAHKRAYKREWEAANIEQRHLVQKAYRTVNAEKIRISKNEWQKANPDKARAAGKRFRERRRNEMIAAYGGKCDCCGETEPLFLTLDHVNGDGANHRRQYRQKGNQGVLRELKQNGWPQEGFRLLCWNCQFGVMQPEGCPHQRQGN